MKRTLKKITSIVLAAMMLVGCLSVSAFAALEEPTVEGSRTITIHGDAADRSFAAYQIFYGDVQKVNDVDSLTHIQWGASIKDPRQGGSDLSSKLIAAVRESDTLKGIFGESGDLSAEEFAGKLELLTDSDAVIEFTQILNTVLQESTWMSMNSKKSVASGDGKNYTISNLHDGYYLVVDVTKDIKAIDPQPDTYSRMLLKLVGSDTTATIKANSAPTVTKVIKDSDLNSEQYSTASIGQEKTFVLTSHVPDMTGYQKYYFVFNDTMSEGINFKEVKSVKIYATDDEGNEITTKSYTLYDKDNPGDGTTLNEQSYQLIKTVADPTSGDKSDDNHGVTTLEFILNNFIQYKSYTNYTVEVTYTGYLNQNAIVGDPSTVVNGEGQTVKNAEGNPNSVYLTYSNDPNVTDSGDKDNPDKPGSDSPVGNTETKTVYLYTAGIDLIKTDGSNGHRLAGAEFQIDGTKVFTVLTKTQTYTPVKYLTENNYTEFSQGAAEYYMKKTDGAFVKFGDFANLKAIQDDTTLVQDTVKYAYDEGTSTYSLSLTGGLYKESGADNYVVINQADSQTAYEQGYTLYTKEETVTPIVKSEKVSVKASVGENGLLELDGLGAGTYTITETKAPAGYGSLTDPIKLTISFTMPTTTSTDNRGEWKFSAVMDDGKNSALGENGAVSGKELRVVNKKGSTLPSTGGMGTTLFYVVGSCLVVGAAVVLISKKRMDGTEF
jgi:fimbrial isopeptide formation D2 family protein/LPXTG-motif cell wall-anchored protein